MSFHSLGCREIRSLLQSSERVQVRSRVLLYECLSTLDGPSVSRSHPSLYDDAVGQTGILDRQRVVVEGSIRKRGADGVGSCEVLRAGSVMYGQTIGKTNVG
jgi:hypothetical protein